MANEEFTNNENRARLRDSINRPTDCMARGGTTSSGDMPPPIRGDAPMTLGPHDGGRRQTDNASKPTLVGVHMGPVSPGYQGISPRVAAELYKAPPYAAATIRDQLRKK